MLIWLVLSKFPSKVIVKLLESKQSSEMWNVEILRKAILQYTRIQEMFIVMQALRVSMVLGVNYKITL